MVSPRVTAALACAIVAAGCGAPAGGGPPDGSPDGYPGGGGPMPAAVDRVVDGDTLVVRMGGARERVRLIGVDAPESVAPGRPVECHGPEASDAAARLAPEGARVRVETDRTQGRRDAYDRLLAYVTVEGERRTLNERLVAAGAARAYVHDRPPRRHGAIAAAEERARAAGRGLWGACPEAGDEGSGDAAPEPAPASGACPPGRSVQGDLPSGIHHRPGDPGHGSTVPEACFPTARAAEAAVFRAPRGR